MTGSAKWLVTILLAVSVGFNVYLLEAALTEAALPTAPVVERVLERRAAQMPKADAALLHQALKDNRPEVLKRTVAARKARALVHTLITVEEVDVAALDAALADLRTANVDLQQTLHRIYVGLADQMSREGRTMLLDRGRGRPAKDTSGPLAIPKCGGKPCP